MSDHDPSGTPTSKTTEAPGSQPVLSATTSGLVNSSTTGSINAAAPTTGPSDVKTLDQKQSFIRHSPSAFNVYAYQQVGGKDLAPFLVDDSGMAPRFHLLSTELFLDWVPGNGPTNEDCKKFKKPELTESMSEHAMYPELAAVVQSVLDAAGCDALRFLDTANHKARDGNSGKKDTFNDGGIYMNTPLAREATEFTAEHRARSTMTAEQLDKRLLGLRSWNWIDILFEIKKSETLSAFYFKTSPPGYKHAAKASAPSPAPDTAPAPESDDQEQETAADMPSLEEDGDDDAHEGESSAKPETITCTVPPFIRLAKEGQAALAQFIEYMHNVRKYQHRMFSYAVYVCYDTARLFLFDRSGAYVSEPFVWTEPDSPLHQFIWKIAKLPNAGRFEELGRDPTAQPVSGDLKDKFMALKNNTALPLHVREGFSKATTAQCPIYQLEVMHGEPTEDEWFPDEPFPPPKGCDSPSTGQPSSDPSSSVSVPCPSLSSDPLPTTSGTAPAPSVRKFLVGRPHFAADGLIGRCTRGYYAYDVTDADERNWSVCFLKDSWRPAVAGRTRPEHLLYERFRRHGITAENNIATLICGGDVGGHWAQKTRVQDYLPGLKRPVPRVHYRIVIEEIGMRLEDFHSFPELSGVFADAVGAHHDVWTSAKVLHRDISVGNIMIRIAPDGSYEGFLIDWDLSRLECELGTGPVEPDRTGTWQFRSAVSLKYPWKPYRVSDDIESFIHAYLYLVLRYHITAGNSLREFVVAFFEGALVVDGVRVGGHTKLSTFQSFAMPFNIPSNPELEGLLKDIFVRCAYCYKQINFPEMDRRYGFEPQVKKTAPAALPPTPTPTVNARRRQAMDRIPYDDQHDHTFINASLGLGLPTKPRDPHADPCDMTGFLAAHGGLVHLFGHHALCNPGHLDKDVDQFLARRHQNVNHGPTTDPGKPRLGTLSVTGTFSTSEQMSSNASSAHAAGLPSTRKQVSTGGASLDGKKRGHGEEGGASGSKENAGNDEGEPSQLVKRAKKALGLLRKKP